MNEPGKSKPRSHLKKKSNPTKETRPDETAETRQEMTETVPA
jgi:hypothetical protein